MTMGRVTLNMLGCRGQSGRRPSESSELRSAGKRGRKNFRHLCLHRRTNPNPLHRTPQRNSVHDNTVPDTSPGWSSHLKWARMSVATGSKGEKAKKFQSLNINNLYQVSRLWRPETASSSSSTVFLGIRLETTAEKHSSEAWITIPWKGSHRPSGTC